MSPPSSAAPVIQSISIPSHSWIESPSSSPYTAYNVRVTTPLSTYTLAKRYSAFETLHTTLSRLAPTPLSLPPRRASWFRSTLTEAELLTRQQGLEAYLRALLVAPSPIHSSSSTFLTFLQPPALSLSNPPPSTKPSAPTPATWLLRLSTLQTSSRTLRASLQRRDALSASPATSAQAHQLTKDAKALVREMDAEVDALREELRGLQLPVGEETRRRGMLETLGEEIKTLGILAVSTHHPPAAAAAGGGSLRSAAAPPTQPGGPARPTGRVLGASAVPAETSATRGLDNGALQQLQQTYMAEQDGRVAELAASLRRQREMGVLIGEELAIQDETMTSLEQGVDRVKGGMKTATGMMKRLG